MVLVWRGDHELARPYFRRAIGLNPADIQIKGDYAEWLRLSGFATEALATIDDALALGPFVPDWFAVVRGHILFDLERYAEAVGALENLPRHYFTSLLYHAVALACSGKGPGAAQVIAKVHELRPGLSLREVAHVIRYEHAHAQQHFMEGLRKAGLPE
jgi:adenylate cyclase